MNMQHGYLAIWFLVVFVIQGFRLYDPNVSYEVFLLEEQAKYEQITDNKITEIVDLAMAKKKFPKINRKEIVMFFHSANFDVKRASTMIFKHYEYRRQLPQIFHSQDEDPEINDLDEVKKVVSCSILFSDSDLYTPNDRYVYTQLINTNGSEYNFKKTVKYFFFMIKCLLIKYGTFDGLVVVLDGKGFNKGHIKPFVQSVLLGRTLLHLIQNAPPLRIKKVYIVNTNDFVNIVYSAASRLALYEDFRQKIVLCDGKNSERVFDHVPREIMPAEYPGGKGPSHTIQAARTYELMRNLHNKYRSYADNAPSSSSPTGPKAPNSNSKAGPSGQSVTGED
ncbi:uncharacterized protein LOC126835939 isoform X1 [Adelges cooleyi]|uniref:uncharacterized protein LOC126834448 isoform X1 n=1 Tax=Adelges cooleyi TaxID=133065 RepID=UPI00217FB9CA|nr:uncharacterized protein LOC126834448 isoform X1 [Adelges cooleyi]XP_050424786.1 uncharacterized protein LOC126835939 isoform X1 [Adelges cooleyi]